jgi:hypothetical protein
MEIGEISSIPNEELKEIDKEGIQYEITVLEEKLAQMKPNMTAIAEYRKKVSCFIIRMYIWLVFWFEWVEEIIWLMLWFEGVQEIIWLVFWFEGVWKIIWLMLRALAK